ncbi:hypothetical protein J7T55_014203 [Diaporthe amygdali]|uniref:uncharacterized protein n=1 Tax=Phomopsis amygdali TaxID=1214568 RepID=UPI0022FEF789|nr:uncharacterized protein J7T55_014203 [Diaporthe amygdali]KAJ0109641.1 hypothetical protein J7T55_014203 [Diaporthe amygdali]
MVSINQGRISFLTDPSENVKHFYNILVAIIFFFIAQLITSVWNQPFWATGLDFPGQIVAMVFVWLVMCAAQVLLCQPGEGLERLYHRYIKAPTEVLNKHMSIGFTIPILNLINKPPPSAYQIGLLIATFAVTGVLNSILVYIVAYHVQLATTKITSRLWSSSVLDIEAARTQTIAKAAGMPQKPLKRGALCYIDECVDAHFRSGADDGSRLDRFRKHISDTSTLCTLSGYMSDSNGAKIACQGQVHATKSNEHDQDEYETPTANAEASASYLSLISKLKAIIFTWLSQNIFLTLSLLVFSLVGLPVSYYRQNDFYLDVGFLFTIWLTFTSAQMCTKKQANLGHRHRKTLAAVATLLNPVLWTSLFLVCYGLAKSSIRNQPRAVVTVGFTTNNTVSDLIANHGEPSVTAEYGSHLGSIPIGAGDVATSILNAGIVSWGLKLFEYRHQIASSGGLTVVATSILASLLNVVAWPLLAHAIGVRPASSDLSFAARSVTIALGGPTMKSLGGDAGVNAVIVVVNGICFQLAAGFFAEGGFGVADMSCKGRLMRGCWAGLARNCKTNGRSEPTSLDQSQGREQGGRGIQMEGLQVDDDRDIRYSSDVTHIGEHRPDYRNDGIRWDAIHTTSNADVNKDIEPKIHGGHLQVQKDTSADPASVVPTVAAGVTIGINAAAMGTAHLYEQNSHAAPYSALSMTMFGVFTVLFTVRGPMTEWLVGRVGGGGTGIE